MRVLLADDHPLFVQAFETLLAPDPRYEIVGIAADGEEAVRLAEELSPDVILLDQGMPEMDGQEVTRRICEAEPAPRVLIFTGSDTELNTVDAHAAGATAFVRKPRSAADLLETLELVRLLLDPLEDDPE